MPDSQTNLSLADPGPWPAQIEAGAAWFSAFLAANPKGPALDHSWPGRAIAAALGRPWDENTRRQLRRFREAAGSVIISGPKGYIHVRHSTQTQREWSAHRKLSQGRKMVDEASRELRAIRTAHAITNPSPK